VHLINTLYKVNILFDILVSVDVDNGILRASLEEEHCADSVLKKRYPLSRQTCCQVL